MKKLVVSGCQATGNLHLGNYLGSIMHWVRMQDDYNCFYFLADSHAITVDIEPEALREATLNSAAAYLASGISPDKSAIFAQSLVPEHAELAWLLNCITPLGWLKRMTQFKDKAGKNQDMAGLGLLSYPVLMAADILIYKADLVPVGEDQKQHLELTRDIAGLINRKFNKEIFRLPEPLIQKNSTRIMSLRDGKRKMSKSDPSDLSRINLADDADQIYRKIKKAKTDNIPVISYDRILRPEISNLIDIYSSITNQSIDDVVNQYSQESQVASFKNDLADILIEYLSPITTEYNKLLYNKDYLLEILKNGAEKARMVTTKTINEVKGLFGFVACTSNILPDRQYKFS